LITPKLLAIHAVLLTEYVKVCELHLLKVEPITMDPLKFAGQTNVLPPVASWQTVIVIFCPAAPAAKVELVTLPVNVIMFDRFAAENVGVAENETTFSPTITPPDVPPVVWPRITVCEVDVAVVFTVPTCAATPQATATLSTE
jgi:hypothetical protein